MSRDNNLGDSRADILDNMRDDRLSVLYRAHMPSAAPSPTSDGHVLQMAREAAAVPKRATVTRGGWRAWLAAPWFGPGLAFATVASLSVVVIALMPKDEMAVEKEVASSAAVPSSTASAPAATLAPGSASGSPSTSSNDAASTTALSSSSSSPRTNAPRAKAATNNGRMTTNEISVAPRLASPPSDGDRATPAQVGPGGPAEPMRRSIAAERNSLAATPALAPFVPSVSQAPAAPVVANAFPASPQRQLATAPAGAATAAVTAPPPPPPAAAVADSARPEKQSLQSETTESRTPAPIAEVPDSAPTYPNESRSSIPLPYSYTMPRKSRDTSGLGNAPRALEKVEKASTPSLAAAAAHRDPTEWVKAILKLKSEGKTEQLTKELTDFRKQYPQYVLPEELRQLK